MGKIYRVLVVISSLALIGMAAACTNNDVDQSNDVTLITTDLESGLEEPARGTLNVDDEGCLTLSAADGTYLLVWPKGATVERDSDGTASIQFRDSILEFGTEVSLVGGASLLNEVVPDVQIADTCRDYESVFLVNPNFQPPGS